MIQKAIETKLNDVSVFFSTRGSEIKKIFFQVKKNLCVKKPQRITAMSTFLERAKKGTMDFLSTFKEGLNTPSRKNRNFDYNTDNFRSATQWRTYCIREDPDYLAKRYDVEDDENYYFIVKPNTPIFDFVKKYELFLNDRDPQNSVELIRPESSMDQFSDDDVDDRYAVDDDDQGFFSDPTEGKKEEEENDIPIPNYYNEQAKVVIPTTIVEPETREEEFTFFCLNTDHDLEVLELYKISAFLGYNNANVNLLLAAMVKGGNFCINCETFVKEAIVFGKNSPYLLNGMKEATTHRKYIIEHNIVEEILKGEHKKRNMSSEDYIKKRREEMDW